MSTLNLPPELRRLLPAARWQRSHVGHSEAEVWMSTRHVVKVQPRQEAPSNTLWDERERLRWLAGRVPVPQVLGYVQTSSHEYLAMSRLHGIDFAHADALLHPQRVVSLLARILQELHALPIHDCPFNMSLPWRLRLARERVEAGRVDQDDFDDPAHTPTGILRQLVQERPQEDLVFTHGDACLPNFILDGEYAQGIIDLGRAGIADRHADLALAHRSLGRNLGPAHAEVFLDLYGRSLIDERKLAYYCLLDELF